MDCLFCKIINGEIPSSKVFEDDKILAFNDINPQAPVHILVVSKAHIASLDALTPADEALVGHIVCTASNIAKEKNLGDGWRLVSNCGEHGGQTVGHLHFHILGGKQLGLTMT